MAKKWKRVIIIVCIFIGLIGILFSPIFSIREIDLSLMGQYEEEAYPYLHSLKGKNAFIEILKNKSLKQSGNIFSFSLKRMEDKLKFNFPYFRDIEIKYEFPNKIRVYADERKPIFLGQADGFYLYIDSEGYLLDVFVEEENLPDLPLVQGLVFENYKIGLPVRNSVDEKIDTTIRVCNLLSQIHGQDNIIDIIDMSDQKDIWMYVRPELSIRLGDENDMSLKLTILKEVFASGYNGDSSGLIDFSKGGYPVFSEND